MSKHLFGIILTPHGVAANNRGDNEGNITTLQKILWNGEQHTTVSAEAIRWAIRWYWQSAYEKMLNRRWDESEKPANSWQDHEFKQWKKYLDDDVLGFMSAQAAQEEGNTSEKEKPKKTDRRTKEPRKSKGKAIIRRARLEITRAVSLTPFEGDITFNAASIGATPSASRTGTDPVPYGTEMHATRYQYGFALTPETLSDPKRSHNVIDAIINLSEVGGNHARFLFDFSPESIVFRYTDDFAPRMLYSFSLDNGGNPDITRILKKVEANDIAPDELVIGGEISKTATGKALADKGAVVCGGVRDAATKIKECLSGK